MILGCSGHRPHKLGGYEDGDETFTKLVKLAERHIELLKPEVVISGMADGWDQAVAQAAIECGVSLYAYIPFAGQDAKWAPRTRSRYRWQMSQADHVYHCADPGYAAWKFQHRNECVANDSDKLLVLWNGSKGGTCNCVQYAVKQRKPILNLWDEFQRSGT